MKPRFLSERGSVLMVALFTITILTFICAVSLDWVSQNTSATGQTTSWQQSLAGAESAVDQAINSLNSGTWTGWKNVSGTVGWSKPSGGSTASGTPGSGAYNYYLPSDLALSGEGSNAVSSWVTVDAANFPSGTAYRIRAVGVATTPGPVRVSNQKLDNDLRQIAMRYDRFSNATDKTVSTPQAMRRVEVIVKPGVTGLWARGITMGDWISGSGSGTIDSFDSRTSPGNQYDPLWKHSNAVIGLINSTGSDLRSTFVSGTIYYNGPAIKNAGNVSGGTQTPFGGTLPTPIDPTASNWNDSTHGMVTNGDYFGSGTAYPTWTGGGGLPKNSSNVTQSSITVGGGANASHPDMYKINGDFTVSGSNIFHLYGTGGGERYVTIWVTGKYTVSGSAQVQQDSNVHAVWVVDSDITTSGDSYQNQKGQASYVSFIGVGSNNKVTVSGSSNFIGTINAPKYDFTISGGGAYVGAAIGNTLTFSGSSSFHYDEALNAAGGGASGGSYSYASWFEDNSDPARSVTY